MTCTVSVVTRAPNISWIDPEGIEVEDSLLTLTNVGGLTTELVLEFQSLAYADIGEYVCSANLSVAEVDYLGMGSDLVTVDIQSKLS